MADRGIGDNSGNLPEPDELELRAAFLQDLKDSEAVKSAQAIKSRHRATAKGKGVTAEHLKTMHRMSEWTLPQIAKHFRGQMKAVGAIAQDVGDLQLDFFQKKTDAPGIAAIKFKAYNAGLLGKADTPPDSLVGEELQVWIDNYNAGASDRNKAFSASLEDTPEDKLPGASQPGGGADDDFEASQEELDKQKPRQALREVKAANDSPDLEKQRADFAADNPGVELPEALRPQADKVEAPVPADAKKAKRESQSQKAERIAREVGTTK